MFSQRIFVRVWFGFFSRSRWMSMSLIFVKRRRVKSVYSALMTREKFEGNTLAMVSLVGASSFVPFSHPKPRTRTFSFPSSLTPSRWRKVGFFAFHLDVKCNMCNGSIWKSYFEMSGLRACTHIIRMVRFSLRGFQKPMNGKLLGYCTYPSLWLGRHLYGNWW